MVSDATYDLCLPVLQDSALEDEDKTDQLEELLKKETPLKGTALENAILDVLWRFREGSLGATSPPPLRHTVLRKPSPAPWPISRAATTSVSSSPRLGASPLAPPGFVPQPFVRTMSSTNMTGSPFTSPRPSPRLAFNSPAIPHSPSLNAYEFTTETSPSQETYGDYGSDAVDWLVNDDAASLASSTGQSGLNAAAAEYVHPQQTEMTPYDMLRSIFGPSKSDDEIEATLAEHGYDLTATISAFMDGQGAHLYTQSPGLEMPNGVVIGKSMKTETTRPRTPQNQTRNGIVCRFWLSTGQCLRADCRFSHDLSNHVCKYWVMGNCLAGDTCIFSHDPSHFMNKMSLEGSSTPPMASALQYGDLTAFPSLQAAPDQFGGSYSSTNSFHSYNALGLTPPPGFKSLPELASEASGRPRQARERMPAAPALDDNEAFPSLGAVAGKGGKKHHGKRGGHGHAHKESPSSLAEVVKMAPSPGPSGHRLGRHGSSSSIRNGENSLAAQAIPNPSHIPWLATGDQANKAYLKARQDAIKHGGLRNKFLQSAAQAWNRNDARAAKALSLRGQSENDLMRKAHREAARELYEERNQHRGRGSEIYVDLHGLHPEEAVEYLEKVLLENQHDSRAVYAITGTGHHSKNGKDKIGKAIRAFLNEWKYAFREFSVPGDRNNVGGILGIDARSWDKSLHRESVPTTSTVSTVSTATSTAPSTATSTATSTASKAPVEEVDLLSQGHEIGDGKVRMLVRDVPRVRGR